jgi:hypothetical protein
VQSLKDYTEETRLDLNQVVIDSINELHKFKKESEIESVIIRKIFLN